MLWSTWTLPLLQGRARSPLTTSRWVASSSSSRQVAHHLPNATSRWPPVRCVAGRDFGRHKKGGSPPGAPDRLFASWARELRLLGQSREDTESQSTTGEIDRSGVPQSYSPERGARWYQITGVAYRTSSKRHAARASSSRRRCPVHRRLRHDANQLGAPV